MKTRAAQGGQPETVGPERREKKAGFLALLGGRLGAASSRLLGPGAGSQVAFVAAAALVSVVAAGIGLWGVPFQGSGPRLAGAGFFVQAPWGAASGRPADAPYGSLASAEGRWSEAGAASSLDYLLPEQGGGPGAEASATESPADSAAAPQAGAPGAAPAAAGAPGPKMIASPPLAGRSGGLASGRLEQQTGLSKGIGGSFNPVYRGPGRDASAARRAPPQLLSSRRAALPQSRGAAGQLALTNRVVRGNLRSPQTSSSGSGLTYDGGRVPSAIGPESARPQSAGPGIGGDGMSSDVANPEVSHKIGEAAPPAPDTGKESNRTPYQMLIYAAVAALGAGMLMLLGANLLASLAKKEAANPATAAAALVKAKWAKMLAGAAALAGIVAALMGLVLAGVYDQVMQGMMFVLAGGVIAFQAAMVFLDDTAAKQAESTIKAKAQQSAEAQWGELI